MNCFSQLTQNSCRPSQCTSAFIIFNTQYRQFHLFFGWFVIRKILHFREQMSTKHEANVFPGSVSFTKTRTKIESKLTVSCGIFRLNLWFMQLNWAEYLPGWLRTLNIGFIQTHYIHTQINEQIYTHRDNSRRKRVTRRYNSDGVVQNWNSIQRLLPQYWSGDWYTSCDVICPVTSHCGKALTIWPCASGARIKFGE